MRYLDTVTGLVLCGVLYHRYVSVDGFKNVRENEFFFDGDDYLLVQGLWSSLCPIGVSVPLQITRTVTTGIGRLSPILNDDGITCSSPFRRRIVEFDEERTLKKLTTGFGVLPRPKCKIHGGFGRTFLLNSNTTGNTPPSDMLMYLSG